MRKSRSRKSSHLMERQVLPCSNVCLCDSLLIYILVIVLLVFSLLLSPALHFPAWPSIQFFTAKERPKHRKSICSINIWSENQQFGERRRPRRGRFLSVASSSVWESFNLFTRWLPHLLASQQAPRVEESYRRLRKQMANGFPKFPHKLGQLFFYVLTVILPAWLDRPP